MVVGRPVAVEVAGRQVAVEVAGIQVAAEDKVVVVMDMVADSLAIHKANLVASMVIDIGLAKHNQAAVGLILKPLAASILAVDHILRVVGRWATVELARRVAGNLVRRKAIRSQVKHQQQQYPLRDGKR